MTNPDYFFITSERGKDQLVYRGFTFTFVRLTSGSLKQTWRCSQSLCKARVDLDPSTGSVSDRKAFHNHPPPDPGKLNRRKILTALISTVVADSSVHIGVSNVKALASEEGVVLSDQDLKCIRLSVYRAKRRKLDATSTDSTYDGSDPPES